MKHLLFKYYGWVAFVAGLALIALVAAQPGGLDWKLVLTILSTLGGFVFFVQRQKVEELRLFKELFTEFNHRYGELNDQLNHMVIGDPGKELTAEELGTLYSYFNLCGEEYLFFDQEFIPPAVWKAWRNGMRYFYEDERIKSVWEKELTSGSYYGLTASNLLKSK